jgi:hypothetical protein
MHFLFLFTIGILDYGLSDHIFFCAIRLAEHRLLDQQMRKTIGYQIQNSNYQTFGYRIVNHYQLSSFAVCVHGRGNKDERRRATGRNVLGGGGIWREERDR